MATSSLTVKKRDRVGKSGAAGVRREKKIPAVIYGKGISPVSVEVEPEDLKKALSTESQRNTLLEVSIENSGDKPALSIIKDVQKDPLTGKTTHLDFHSINPDTALVVEVPVEFTGRSQGIRDGGILEEIERTLRVRCLPENIPSKIEVDITEVCIGDSLHVRDLSFDEGIEVLNNPDDPVVMVIAPRAAISEAAAQKTGEGEEEEEAADGETAGEEEKTGEEAPAKEGEGE